MPMGRTNRQLLQHIGVEIPEGAVSFHTEKKRVRGSNPEIIFAVKRGCELIIHCTTLTDKQHDWMFQQGRFRSNGSKGWQLDEE